MLLADDERMQKFDGWVVVVISISHICNQTTVISGTIEHLRIHISILRKCSLLFRQRL